MASNYKVQFSVSLTPTVVNDADQSVETTAIDNEIRKSLGGAGILGDIDGTTMLANGTEVTGYAAGVASYLSTNGATGGDIVIPDKDNSGTINKIMVFIKNTGFASSVGSGSSSTLGDKLTRSGNWTTAALVEVRIANASGAILAQLYPGEAIIFPRIQNQTLNVSAGDNSANIAVESAMIFDGTT